MANNDLSIQWVGFENHKLPEYNVVKNKDYVLYGKDNLYPNYLIELLSRSSKHNAIVNSKARFVTGGGFKSEAAKEFLENKYSNEDADEVVKKLSLDYEIFKGYCLGVTWSQDKKKIASYQHVDFSKIRRIKECGDFLYCEDWSDRIKVNRKEFTVIKQFSETDRTGFQLIYYIGYSPYYKDLLYPLPNYLGAVPAIETDVEIANFHLNNIKNGYSGGTVFILKNGEPTAEKKREIESQLKKKHTGTDKAGGIIVIYANRGEDAAEIKNINPSDLDKLFQQLRTDTTQEIFAGHEVTSPMLFGIKESGQLGGRNELIESFELFNNSYVATRQKMFNTLFNKLAYINGYPKDIELQKVKPINIDFTNPTIQAVMTKNEIREAIGLPPLDVEDVVVKEQMSRKDPNRTEVAILKLISQFDGNADETMLINELQLDAKEVRGALRFLEANYLVDKIVYGTNSERTFTYKITDLGNFYTTSINPNDVISVFKKYGVKCSEYTFISERNFADLSVTEKRILGIIKGDNKATAITIAKDLKADAEQVQKIIDKLVNDEMIIVGNEDNVTTLDLTDKAIVTIDEQKIRTIETKYKYKAKDGKDIIPTTRPFCAAIINEEKYYSREEIDMISGEVGFSVWNYRGGWYHNPKTDENQPFCRHIWQQVSVVKK